MKRVLCVWLPDFPMQRLLDERPELKSIPTVLYVESGNRAEVVWSSSDAKRHGIRSGLSLSEAQALLESAVFLPHDPNADLRELESLAALCHHYSPIVGLELSCETHCLVLDITGCTHLFGDESSLTRQLVVDLAERGYFAHVAVAGTVGAAWAISRFGHGTGRDRRLRSLPVESLRISAKIASQLREFDLRTVGSLLAVPRDSLPSRFGKQLLERLDEMFGRREEAIIPVHRPEPVSAEWATEEPICHPNAVLHVCSDLLSEILDTVTSRGEGVLRLTLALQSEAAGATLIETGLSRPTDSPPHLLNLLQMKLDAEPISVWLNSIELTASVTAPMPVRQRWLFHRDESDDSSEVSRLIDRLSTRLGRDAVVHAEVLPEAIPEQTIAWRSMLSSGIRKNSEENQVPEFFRIQRPGGEGSEIEPTIASTRPLRLLPRPEPVDSVCSAAFRRMLRVKQSDVLNSPEGETVCEALSPPAQFTWDRRSHWQEHNTDPEQIKTAWWQETGQVHRHYCQLETRTGCRFWLFQEKGQWFVHGIFE